MFNSGFHPFHLVTSSPWPILSSTSLFSFVMVMYFYTTSKCSLLVMSFFMMTLILTVSQWFRDIICESTYMSCHGLYMVILMYIVSEVSFLFFPSFLHTISFHKDQMLNKE